MLLFALLFFTDDVEAKKKKKKKKHIDDDFVLSDKDMDKKDKQRTLKVGKKYKKSENSVEQELIKVRRIPDVLERIDKLNNLIKQTPRAGGYWLQRGKAKQEKSFSKEAIADYDKTVELDPDFEGPAKMAMFHKAEVQKSLGLPADAVKTLTAVMSEIDTSFPQAMALRGELYFKQQMYAKAIDQLGEAIAIDDSSVEVAGWAFRWRAEAKFKQQNFADAREDYDKCIEVWEALPAVTAASKADASLAQRELRTVRFQRGDILCQGHCGGEFNNEMQNHATLKPNYEEAIKDFGFVVKSALTAPRSTNHAVACARMGLAYLRLNENEKAVEVFTDALQGAPNEAGWIMNRGLANARLDAYKEATADYTMGIQLNPANFQVCTYSRPTADRASLVSSTAATRRLSPPHPHSPDQCDCAAGPRQPWDHLPAPADVGDCGRGLHRRCDQRADCPHQERRQAAPRLLLQDDGQGEESAGRPEGVL